MVWIRKGPFPLPCFFGDHYTSRTRSITHRYKSILRGTRLINLDKNDLGQNYTTVDPKQLHKSHMKFWRQTQNTDTASQPTWEASWETRPETRERQNQGGGHGIPANVETRPETRESKDQGGGHSIPAKMGNKLGDKSKTRRTQQW